jgi:hypothetical protein
MTDAFDTLASTEACTKNPDTVPQTDAVSKHQCWDEFGKSVNCDGKVAEIRGGETLRVISSNEPGFVPLVYLGHHQKFVLWCGNFGEQGTKVHMDGDTISCP